MPVLFEEEVDSTNLKLKSMFLEGAIEDATWLIAHSQYAGKGQRGNSWQSEAGKNATLSLYKEVKGLAIDAQFKISMQVALSVARVLSIYLKNVSVKWPNDILVNDKKIGGILIETGVKGNSIGWVIVGIGINIEQKSFVSLPQASSTFLEGAINLKAKDFITQLMPVLLEDLIALQNFSYLEVQQAYEKQLYGFLLRKKFKTPQGQIFEGFIQGINSQGALMIAQSGGIIKAYGLKEISMIF